jgi:hypothetical protein
MHEVMQKILSWLRWVVFGMFIICSAIIASIAVWNYTLPGWVHWDSQRQVDIYLAFVGCFGLALILPFILIELARKDSLAGRVWFECLWVSLCWVLYLAGAIAMSASAPNHMCQTSPAQCVTSNVVMAFIWIGTATLSLYLWPLLILTIVRRNQEPRVWQCYVREFPFPEFRQSLSTPPASPLPRFLRKAPSIVAPRPQRAVPRTIYSYRSGLGSEYEIEHYRPPSTLLRPERVAVAAAPTSETWQPSNSTSFYPQYLRPILTVPRPSHDAEPNRYKLPTPPSPPPLGDWPRMNATLPSQPGRSKRKPPPFTSAAPNAFTSTPSSTYPRPSGPRSRSNSHSLSTAHPGLSR